MIGSTDDPASTTKLAEPLFRFSFGNCPSSAALQLLGTRSVKPKNETNGIPQLLVSRLARSGEPLEPEALASTGFLRLISCGASSPPLS
jgi:hypothetical protein